MSEIFTKEQIALARLGYCYTSYSRNGMRSTVRDLLNQTHKDVVFCKSDYATHVEIGKAKPHRDIKL